MDIKHSLLRIAAALILLSSTMLACSLTTNTYHRADNQLVDSEGPEVLPRKPARFNKWIRIGLSDL